MEKEEAQRKAKEQKEAESIGQPRGKNLAFSTLFLLLVFVLIGFNYEKILEQVRRISEIQVNPEPVIEPVWNDKNIHIKEYAESVNEKLDDFATSVMNISAPYFEQNFENEFKNCMQNVNKF